MIRVVVIDDSAFMRKALSIMLESDPEIKVIGSARDGEEGFQVVKRLKPDLVTLDVEMPRTNGLQCLKMIMQEIPTPVLIVSSITTEGAKITLEALNLGAVDYIAKSQSFVAIDITKIKDDLIAKVKYICRSSKYAS
jgi:two-component system chemotaxis response regulator CheB